MDGQLTELYAHRAATCYNGGYYERAIDDFNQAIERQPANAKLYYGRDAAYHKTGDYDRSILDCDQVIKACQSEGPVGCVLRWRSWKQRLPRRGPGAVGNSAYQMGEWRSWKQRLPNMGAKVYQSYRTINSE